MSNTRPPRGRGTFRVRSVTQFPEPRTIKPSARELFPTLRARLLASRPLISAEKVERPGKGGRAFDRPRYTPAVYGAPAFRNVSDEKGAWV